MNFWQAALLAASLVAASALSAQAQNEDRESRSELRLRLPAEEQLPGKPILIQGRVMAKETGQPLSYTNVFIEGTGFGTMALSGGRFWLRGLPPGDYKLHARYISYGEVVLDISVVAGDLVDVEFWMDIKPIEFDPFIVRAERRTIILEETGSAHRIDSDTLDDLPVDGVVDLVGLQAGVTLDDNEIHIRGGRADDTQFNLDGLSSSDPLGGGRAGIGVDADLVSEIEVLTGGFGAEHGQAVSGVVNVRTREGAERFDGRFNYRSDSLSPDAVNYNTDKASFTFSGPNLLWEGLKKAGLNLPGKQYFIANVSGNISDTQLPTESLRNGLHSPLFSDRWSPRVENDWSGRAKLTWKFGPSKKVNLSYSNERGVSQGYRIPGEGWSNAFQNTLDTFNVVSTENILSQAAWHHVLGEDSFYDIVVGRQFNRVHKNKNGNDDFSTYIGPIFHEEFDRNGAPYFVGALDGGDADEWHDHYSDTMTFKGDYTFMAKSVNQLGLGIEFTAQELQYIDLSRDLGTPPPGFLALSQDIFTAHPRFMSAYFQDRLTYRGLILNAGLRFDGWAPGREVDDVISRPEDFIFIFDEVQESYYKNTTSVFGRRWKSRLSPRVGVSFPISPRDKFFFNYGHFSQWPRPNYVYAQLETDFATNLQLLGNPDLEPKITVQYETGIQHEFDNLWSASLTFYNNDIYGYAQGVGLPQITIDPVDTPDPNDTTPATVSPVRYFNADAARTLGVEFSVVKQTRRWLSGSATAEFQRSRGTRSSANSTFLSAQLGEGSPDFQDLEGIKSVPLVWDRPWKLQFNLSFAVDERIRPRLFGKLLPANWNANLLYRAWAGARYTASFFDAEDRPRQSPDTLGEMGPYRSSLDLKIVKFFQISRHQKLSFFFEGRNLLNHDNFRRVNPWTGKPYRRFNWDGNIASARLNGSERSTATDFYVEDAVDLAARTDWRTAVMGVSYKW